MINIKEENLENNLKILACILFIIASSIFIVIINLEKEDKNNKELDEYRYYAYLLILISNLILSYYGYKELEENKEIYKKTGNYTDLKSSQTFFIASILQLISVIIVINGLNNDNTI